MEDLVAAMMSLAATLEAVKSTVDQSNSVLKDFVAWRPHVDGAPQDMRSDNSTLPQLQLGRVALNPDVVLDLSTHQGRATPAIVEGGASAAVEFGSSFPATETHRRGTFTSQQRVDTWSTRSDLPWASSSVSKLGVNQVEDPNDLNITVPTRCSTLGFSPSAGDVEVAFQAMQPGIVSTVSPGPVGASPPSTRQKFDILKLDKHTPTTCLMGVHDNGGDAKSTKRDADTIQGDLSCTRAVAVPLPATTPPHPPDQHRLLLARPPPWPVWMASAPSTISPTIRYTHGIDHVVTTSSNGEGDCTGWLLHGPVELSGYHSIGSVTMPWDPGEKLIMPWLYPCVCCQVNIFEWIRLQQINEASMVCSVRSALRCGNSLDVSLFYKHDHTQLDSKGTQFDFREQINGSVEQADNMSYHLDNLYSLSMQHVSISVVVNRDEKFTKGISFSSVEKGQFKCPRMLHYHVSAACTVAHEGIYSWLIVNTRSELDLRYKGEYTSAIMDKEIMCSSCTLQAYSAGNVEVPMVSNQLCSLIIFSLTTPWDPGPWQQIARQASRPSFWTELQKLNPIGVQIAMVLHLILLQQNLGMWCKPNMIFPTYSSSYSIGMTATCWVFVHLASGRYGGFSPRSTLAQSKRRQYFCSLTSILSTFTQTFASGDISCAEIFPPHSMIPLIVHATNSSTETKIPDWTATWATCENFLARASPDFVAFFDGSRGDLVMLSISLPWDPGVCNELNTEKLRSWFAEQQW